MPLFVFGVNHSATPVAIREKLAITPSRLQAGLEMLKGHYSHAVILSTCNRTEIYYLAHTGREAGIMDFFAGWSGLSRTELEGYLYNYQDYEAFHHLFEVAAGLDSMIVGEYEVLGQVKHSLEAAGKTGMAGLKIQRLFDHAILAGRRVRAETGISQNALSISSVAVDQIERAAGDIRDCRTLIVGAGEAGWLAAEAISRRGGRLVIYNRSSEKAELLAGCMANAELAAKPLIEELAGVDTAISCTAAAHQIISRAMVEEVMTLRPDRPLVLIDIAVPRDIAEEAQEVPGVHLYNIDDLNHICRRNLEKRLAEVDRAKVILAEEIERFNRWWQSQRNRPVIQALYQKAESIRRTQFRETTEALPRLDTEAKTRIEAMSQSIVNKLLHSVVDKLKLEDPSERELDELVSELFNLEILADEKNEV